MLAALSLAEESARIRIRPIAFHRGLPHVFFDQSVDSLKAQYSEVEFVERLHAGQMAELSYALVAWKPGPRSERVEVMAVAVNGERAWDLELSCPASAYPASRQELMSELQALSRPYIPPVAGITVRAKGRAVPIAAERAAELLWDVEVLIASCSVPAAASSPLERPALELSVRYAELRALGLGLGDAVSLAIEEIRIVADASRNEGWPLERIRHRGGEVGLTKCDGGGTLRLLCRPELRPHAPESVTRNCGLLAR